MPVHLSATRSTALWFLLGALLVGGVLGFTADRVAVTHEGPSHMMDPRAMRARLFHDLRATPAQQVVLDSLLDARHRAEAALYVPLQGRLDSLNKATREQIELQLDPEQQATFEKMVAKMDARMHAHRPPGPPPPSPQ